jgi:NAD(P)-dependent dehydrogenase (short-subunit alcohol dehydrogenase family)
MTSVDPLTNRLGHPLRVLVVGASSGIGATTAKALVGAGARVAGAARRADRIAELSGVLPVTCDASEEKACDQAVQVAASEFGGLDAVVYATGITPLTPLDAAGSEDWHNVLATNVIGAALITKAALPHLRDEESDGRAVFLTSDSAVKPYPGLVPYGASKAALSAFCSGLASEFRELRVTEVMVGPTMDTEVSDHFDPDALSVWFPRWHEEGFVRFGYQLSADVATAIDTILRAETPDALVVAAAPPETPS